MNGSSWNPVVAVVHGGKEDRRCWMMFTVCFDLSDSDEPIRALDHGM